IRELKAAGIRISEIAAHFSDAEPELPVTESGGVDERSFQSIAQIVFPAILVNRRWEIISINGRAERLLFKEQVQKIPSAAKRNIIRLFLEEKFAQRFANWKDIVTVHINLAKRDLTEHGVEQIGSDLETNATEELKELWRKVEPLRDRPISQQKLALELDSGKTIHYTLFSSDFREGTLLLYTPATMQLDQILDLLLGREKLIKAVLFARIPSLTPLCILAARLESELHLRTALPPTEYFDLITEIILLAHQCFKKHGGTPGRSFHEGVVGFFLSEPDSPKNYLCQALLCAQALQQVVKAFDGGWKVKKAWNNTLQMSMGLHCGDEWLGTVPSSLAFEFTVMGNTLVETRKLSEFAHGGSIWASKSLIENLLPVDRKRVDFGIRFGPGGTGFMSRSIYSQVRELVSDDELERRALVDIGNLPVTEVVHVHRVGDDCLQTAKV
ncbi:MAG: hypothetical protein JSU72_19815, partial [Deltaproteobacteria bacterium]